MYGLSLVSLFMIFLLWMLTSSLDAQSEAADLQRAQGAAAHLSIYGSIVRTYVSANPGAAGSIGDSSLGMPPWFHRVQGESNVVAGGKAFVYYNPGDLVFAKDVARLAGGSSTGVKSGGAFVLPGGVASTTALPGAIPDGAVVIAL